MSDETIKSRLAAAGLRVKPLEWDCNREDEDGLQRHWAWWLSSGYTIYKNTNESSAIEFSVIADDWQIPDETVTYSTLDEAKACCQTDLEKQVLEWLEVAP